jgi:hypothetical protein
MGTALNRQDGFIHEPPTEVVQFIPLGPPRRSSRYLFAELVRRKQLRKSSIQSDGESTSKDHGREGDLHSSSSDMTSSELVSNSSGDEHRLFADDPGTTIKHYNAWWRRFKKYCKENEEEFLPASERTIAEFITEATANSTRPGGLVAQACTAISQVYKFSRSFFHGHFCE